jgi:hypothetical protein
MGGSATGRGRVARTDAGSARTDAGSAGADGGSAGAPPGPGSKGSTPSSGSPSDQFRLENLLLLDADDTDAVPIDSVTFSEGGVGVVSARGERPRVLPWSSVMSHVVEPWSGGVIPEWWVDPELNRRGPAPVPASSVIDSAATNRPADGRESGALIGIQTPTQTYRFLIPGGDVREISRLVTAFALRYQGPDGASSVTRVVRWGQDAERRSEPRPQKRGITWADVQPILVVALVVFLCAAVTVILLQSAGAIHLPYLGGYGSGAMGAGSGRTGLLRMR